MHVMVIGAGLAGVTTAWYLCQAGFSVSVVERRDEAGLETSFANGGQISISHPEPWANPGAPFTILRWLGREDAPLLFRARAEAAQWRWGLAFLRECLPARTRRNTAAIASLAAYSQAQLARLRLELDLHYDELERGVLHLFFTEREFRHARAKRALLDEYGIPSELCSAERCVEIEPALAGLRASLAGGLYGMRDESGDAHRFTQQLAVHAVRRGVSFHHGSEVLGFELASGAVAALRVRGRDGGERCLAADAFVLCAGSYSPLLTAPLGERLRIYPVKGYSVTVPLRDPARAPTVSLTDESRRIVCSRLGNRLRVAGTAELNGYDLSLNPARIQAILDWLELRLPGAADPAGASAWCGLRPATPNNLPLIGPARIPGLYYNTGHGTLGWTLACGSAAALADILLGKLPASAFPFLQRGALRPA